MLGVSEKAAYGFIAFFGIGNGAFSVFLVSQTKPRGGEIGKGEANVQIIPEKPHSLLIELIPEVFSRTSLFVHAPSVARFSEWKSPLCGYNGGREFTILPPRALFFAFASFLGFLRQDCFLRDS